MATEARRAPRVAREATNLCTAGAELLARAAGAPRATTLPAFDPTSPDAAILGAYERIRSNSAWVYSFDGLPDHSMPTDEFERRDALQIADEEVLTSAASTIPGVIAQMLRHIAQADQSRWVDRGLAEHGFLALYQHRRQLEAPAQHIAESVMALLEIEWAQNLATYEKSAADFTLALQLKNLNDAERFRLRREGEEPGEFLLAATEYGELVEDRYSNSEQLSKLVRTLVPNHAAYLRKVDIILAEGFEEDATPWLARDTSFLAGRIENAGGEA